MSDKHLAGYWAAKWDAYLAGLKAGERDQKWAESLAFWLAVLKAEKKVYPLAES